MPAPSTGHLRASHAVWWRNNQVAAARVAEVMLPVRHSLEHVIAALLGDADELSLRVQCANFVGGICVMHEQGQEIARRFGHPVPRTESGLDLLADTITEFAVGGIERIRNGADRASGS